MSQFVLVRVVPGEEPVVMQDYGPYADGRDAARDAKHLSEYYNYKVQPRRIGELPDWRPREVHRRETGYYASPERAYSLGLDPSERGSPYAPIPEGFELALDPDHCALVFESSEDEPTISFFESDTKARLDQRTNLKTGRYLKRYFPHILDDQLKRLVALVDPPVEALFAWTRDEIRRVYVEGPSSCMSMAHRFEWDGLPCHPVEVYAAGDLAVAYIVRGGRITARTLCWPARKQYGRIYGDKHRLKMALLPLGYRHTEAFQGARMLRIPATREIAQHRHMLQDRPDLQREGFLVPYLDNVEMLVDRGDHLITAPAPRTDRSSTPHVHGGIPSVSIPAGWCDVLKQWAEGPVFRIRGLEQTWSQRALYDSDIQIFQCQATRTYWPRYGGDKNGDYHVHLRDRGVTWCREYFATHGFTCAMSGRNCANDDRTERDGKPVSRRYLQEVEERERRDAQRREVERAQRERRDQYDLSFGSTIAFDPAFRLFVGPDDAERGWRAERMEMPGIRRRMFERDLYGRADDWNVSGVTADDELREAMDRPVTLGEAVETTMNVMVTNANRPPSNPMPSYAEVQGALREAISRPLQPMRGLMNYVVEPAQTLERIVFEARPADGWASLWGDPASTPEPEPDPRRRPWHGLIENDQIRSTRQGRRQQRRRG